MHTMGNSQEEDIFHLYLVFLIKHLALLYPQVQQVCIKQTGRKWRHCKVETVTNHNSYKPFFTFCST